MARRRGLLGPMLPWLFALALVALVGNRLHEALKARDEDLVAHAEELRRGDPRNEVDKAPILALHILDPLLEREPANFQARLSAARAWADLRSYAKAVEHLIYAAEHAESVAQESAARRMAIHYLIMDDLYDEAVAQAQAIVDLQPGAPLPPLQLGAALYKSSVSSQESIEALFVDAEIGAHELEIQERIEAYVTDLWAEPEVDPLVAFLAAEADREFREDLRERLLDTRSRFLQASEVMADYRDFDGFDVQVAQAYVELLLRSGRIFDAHVEAAIALRRDDLPLSSRRSLWEVQAEACAILGEPALAADRYEDVVDAYVDELGWSPPRFPAQLIAYRVEAQQWDWILANERRMAEVTGDDIWWTYARCKALLAADRLEEALALIEARFTSVSLGALMPVSLRSDPRRRRDVLLLAYQIFDAAGDSRARDALDSLLDAFPDDLEGRRTRAQLLRRQGFLEGAMEDAFRLLREDRRDAGDFDLWIRIADELSVERHGAGLESRALTRIQDESSLTRASVQASFQESRVNRRSGRRGEAPTGVGAFPTQDPALAFHVVEARVASHDQERARNDARQLVQAHPQVQEFRYRLGRMLVREGKLDSAAEVFRQLTEQVPGDTESLDLAMRVEVARGHDDEAADLVNRMILRDPLGVGAVRYAQRLIEDGLTQRAIRLIERLLAYRGGVAGLDVLTMAGRAHLLQGEYDAATSFLQTLIATYPQSSDVALLGIELGLAQDIQGLVDAAVEALRPLSAGLFPDQVEDLARRLVDARRYEELLRVFPDEERALPALAPARRPLVRAAKAIGHVEEADDLLELVDDELSLRDRFLLLALDGHAEEATRALRLSSTASAIRSELDLCLLVGDALDGDRVLTDSVPTQRLRELGMDRHLDPLPLELFDAVLRLLPSTEQTDRILPASVVASPRVAYPRAGDDVARLLALCEADPEQARRALSSLALMLLAGERPFWARESRALAEHVLAIAPDLHAPSVLLAQRLIDEGDPQGALSLLRQVLTAPEPDLRALALFMRASRHLGKEAWGVGLGLLLADGRPDVLLVVADGLNEGGRPEEAVLLYERLLAEDPSHLGALRGSIQSAELLRDEAEVVRHARTIVDRWPEETEALSVCADALADLRSPDPEAVALMERLVALVPQEHGLAVALARVYEGEPDRVEGIVADMLVEMDRAPVHLGSPEAFTRTLQLMGVAGTARRTGLPELTRDLNTRALRLQPGNVMLYRELAFLELEAGHLDVARRYLEVLSFVDRSDKEPPLALARLLFEQIGQPHLAAEVIRRAYPHSIPPVGVEILAAEYYLRGRIDDALASFQTLRNNPLVTPETVLNAARMAFAAERDAAAATAFEMFLLAASNDHPARARAEALLAACVIEAATASG